MALPSIVSSLEGGAQFVIPSLEGRLGWVLSRKGFKIGTHPNPSPQKGGAVTSDRHLTGWVRSPYRAAHTAPFRKFGFTLAEVLITLGIIGVVAAMTLPGLINGYKEQELITRTKKTYTSIAQALELAQADYSTPGDNSALFSSSKSSAEVTKELFKYFNGAKFCTAGSNASGCRDLSYKIKYSSPFQTGDRESGEVAIGSMVGYPRIVLNNGAVLGVWNNANDCQPYQASGTLFNSDGSYAYNEDGTRATWSAERSECGAIIFDVNGSARPNQFGRDAYRIVVNKSNIAKYYWNVYGSESLLNIMLGKTHPFVYTDYNEDDRFEW